MCRTLLLVIIILAGLLPAGCSESSSLEPAPPQEEYTTIPEITAEATVQPKGSISRDRSDDTIITYEFPTIDIPQKGLWLRGSNMVIKDIFPGYSPKDPVEYLVGNGIADNITREIYISIAPEDDEDLGEYEQLPEEYYDWFQIDVPFFVLEPGESRLVYITIQVPNDMNYRGKKARCALLVLGYTVIGTSVDVKGNVVNQVSNVPIGVASEWYIETAE